MAATNVNLRAFVDWDGDGWLNRGSNTDPRNLCINPLTLYKAVQGVVSGVSINGIEPKNSPSSSGLFKWSNITMQLTTGITRVGYNLGSSGNFVGLFIPSATGDYTIQGRLSQTSATPRTVQIKVNNVYPSPENGTNITQTPITITIPASNVEVFFSYTFTITNITNMVISLQVFNPSATITMSLKGVSAYSGIRTSEIPFNVGTELSKYDNIGPDIVSANWQLGATSPYDNIASEGTCNLQLDNSLKKFSVEDVNSPFYSFNMGTDINYPTGHYPYTFPQPLFAEGVIISVEVYNDLSTTWVEVWRGFIENLSIGTGQGSPIATLSAIQGFFKFDATHINPQAVFDTDVIQPGTPPVTKTADQLFVFLLDNYAVFPVVPYMAAVNKTTGNHNLSWNVVSATNAYSLDTNPTSEPYDPVQAWGSDTTLMTALKDLCVVTQGLFFIKRDGTGRFINRDAFYTNNPAAPADLVWDNLLSNADSYTISQSQTNSVKVEYSPVEEQNGTLWFSKTPIKLAPKEIKTVHIKFTYPEGGKISVKSVNAFNDPTNPSTVIAKNALGVTLARQNILARIVSKASEADLILQNLSTSILYATVTIKGNSIISEGSTYSVKNLPISVGNLGTREFSVNSKLIVDDTQADGLASHLLSVMGSRYQTFSSITISSRDQAWLDRILTASIGSRIKYKEMSYSGGIYHRVMIVGETGNWTPGILTMTYVTRPADNYPYLNLDTTYYKLGGVVY